LIRYRREVVDALQSVLINNPAPSLRFGTRLALI